MVSRSCWTSMNLNLPKISWHHLHNFITIILQNVLETICFSILIIDSWRNFLWNTMAAFGSFVQIVFEVMVRQTRNDFFKPTFLPKKNEQIRLCYLSTCFCLFFWRKWRRQKDISKLTDLYQRVRNTFWTKMSKTSHCGKRNEWKYKK